LFVASLVGRRVVTPEGTRLGRLSDLVVSLDEPRAPAVRGLVIRARRRDRFVAIAHVQRLDAAPIVAAPPRVPPGALRRRTGEFRVGRDILDRQVVDVPAARVVRVNDAAVAEQDGAWRMIGVDVGVGGLLRRLAPQALHPRLTGPVLEWSALAPLAIELEPAPGSGRHARLAALHAADLGRVIDHLPGRQGAELVAALDDAVAADAIEEVEATRQARLLEQLPDERAARILDHMAPDAAADVLADLPPQAANHLMGRMDKEAAAKVRLLLTYPQDSAGGLMTTDFVVAIAGETTREAIEYVRGQLRKPDLIYYVYVVDDPDNQRLLGVVSLRDLLLADGDTPLASYMRREVRTVQPEQPATAAACVMREYNLLALPVVDRRGRMLGLITADDVLNVLLPESLRRHVPRLFS
jgi:CBS domain-containing protein/sporulation protein YlmC with PRC-barrel domain